ncbi:hypothetical protein P3W83_24155 [Cupriavidus basilensis]|nr:hypothetical protein [Cupriavidus basilensis]
MKSARLIASGQAADLGFVAEDQIARLRRLLRIDPRNPVLLVDLAREYAAIGKISAAQKAMSTALGLANDNRWIVRMAARFMIHAGLKDQAHTIVANHPQVKDDPWLLSAELALAQAAGRAPRFWTRAKNLLEGRLAPQHLSELACAVGTLELSGGNNKKAKRNFRQALMAPSDNALAQIKWAERTLRTSLATDSAVAGADRAFEARFWTDYYQGDMQGAFACAGMWRAEEPYSKRPATMRSYIASLLDDSKEVAAAAKLGLMANPDDNTLQLNLIYAELSDVLELNEADERPNVEAETIESFRRRLRRHLRDSHYAGHAYANLGLIHYRLGFPEAGAIAYRMASELAAAQNDPIQEATTRIFHAKEAILARSSSLEGVLAEARTAMLRVKSPGLKFYLAKLELLLVHPERRHEILSPSFELPRAEPERRVVQPIRFNIDKKGATIWLPKGHKPGA